MDIFKAIKENDIKYIYFDKDIYDNTHTIFFGNIVIDIAKVIRNNNVKLNAFYFARKINNTSNEFFDSFLLLNPNKKEIFIYYNRNKAQKMVLYNNLQHIYFYKNIYVASSIELKNFDKYKTLKTYSKFNNNKDAIYYFENLNNHLELISIQKATYPIFCWGTEIGSFGEKKSYFQYLLKNAK